MQVQQLMPFFLYLKEESKRKWWQRADCRVFCVLLLVGEGHSSSSSDNVEGSKARMNYHSVARNANGMAYLRPARLLFLVDRWLRKRERMLPL